MKTTTDLYAYAQNVEILREDILRTEYPPELRKTPPLFSVAMASSLLDMSYQSLQRLIREGGIECNEDDNNKRVFTLEQLDIARKKLQSNTRKKDYYIARPENIINPYVISVANLKGGSSKTTTAFHLAQYLAMQGYRVLAIDSDPQASLSSMLGKIPLEGPDVEGSQFVSPEQTLLNLYSESKQLKPEKTYWHNLDLIPSSIRLFDAEFIMPSRQMNEDKFQFHRVLHDELRSSHFIDYDIIVIDCAPSFSYVTLNAIYSSDAMIVPVPPSHLDILATGAFFDQLNLVLTQIEEAFSESKSFDFILGLRTRMESDLESLRNGSRIAEIFGGDMIQEQAIISKAVKVAADKNMSIYELNGEGVNSRTYKRAIECFNAINREVLLRVIDAWSVKSKHFSKTGAN